MSPHRAAPHSPETWAAFAAAVTARMAELPFSLVEIARKANLSDYTVRGLRDGTGKVPTTKTLVKLERALGWAPGSAAAIVAGGSPTTVSAGPRTAVGPASIHDALATIRDLVADLSPEERTAVLQELLRDLEDAHRVDA